MWLTGLEVPTNFLFFFPPASTPTPPPPPPSFFFLFFPPPPTPSLLLLLLLFEIVCEALGTLSARCPLSAKARATVSCRDWRPRLNVGQFARKDYLQSDISLWKVLSNISEVSGFTRNAFLALKKKKRRRQWLRSSQLRSAGDVSRRSFERCRLFS